MEEVAADFAKLREEATILRALGHPVRLCIVKGLAARGGCNVSHMQECLDIPQSTVSQHLGVLKAAGIVAGKREGVKVNYHLINPIAAAIVRALEEAAPDAGQSKQEVGED